MKLPETIRVAHTDVNVEKWWPPSANANHRWGEFSTQENIIRVQVENRPFAEVLSTLIHEINHAIYYHWPIEDTDKEERICSILGTAWAAIFRDNPELIAFIAGEYQSFEEWVRVRRDA